MDEWTAKRVRVDEETGCWVWIRSKNYGGYGLVCHVNGDGNWLAHRYIWHVRYGRPLPEQLHHVCHVRACVNPAHLLPTTNGEHRRRFHPPPDHCKYGHLLDEENTYIRKDNPAHRQCRKCKARRERERVQNLPPEERARLIRYRTERRRKQRLAGR